MEGERRLNRKLVEIALKNKKKFLIDESKVKELGDFPKAIMELCLEKGCNIDDILKIGSTLMFYAAASMIKKKIPKKKVTDHMDYIYSCVKGLLEEED